ncbi:MAG: methyltransferase family protein [Candidatus Hodarchaeales archaeon]|jgi:protein-S-isoprenylcysteine O-methyltransferase Ste14
MKIIIKNDRYFIIIASLIWGSALIISVIDFSIIQSFNIDNVYINIFGLFLFCFGVSVRLICRFTLKKGFSYMLKVSENHKLITTGIYKFVRHPAYTGDVIAQLGLTVMLTSVIGTLIMSLLFLPFLYRIKLEEEMLLEHFGEDYKFYMKKTKKLLPFLY